MSASIVEISDLVTRYRGWTEQQRADLYRVADMLNWLGLNVVAESGMSDEGDPWFVFSRADTGEVVVHFARIDGTFVAASLPTEDVVRGRQFRDVIDALMRRQPAAPLPSRQNWRDVYSHPIAAVAAFVATALVVAREKSSAPPADEAHTDEDGTFSVNQPPRPEAVHNQIAALLRTTAATPDHAATQTGWDSFSLARLGVAATLLFATDAFAFAAPASRGADDLDQTVGMVLEDRAIRDEDRVAAAQDSNASDGQALVRDAAATALAHADGNAAETELRAQQAIALVHEPAVFEFKDATPEDMNGSVARDHAAEMAHDASLEIMRSSAAYRRDGEIDVALIADAAQHAGDEGMVAPIANPAATPSEAMLAPAAAPTVAMIEVVAYPVPATSEIAVQTVDGLKTFIVGGSSGAALDKGFFAQLLSINDRGLVFTPQAGKAAPFGANAAGSDPLAAASASPSTLLRDLAPTTFLFERDPAAASINITGAGQVMASADGGRHQTVRLGAEADVVMITPGLSHIRIENFTRGVDQFYVSQWLLDHMAPRVTITALGDIVMDFHHNFSITLVGLEPPTAHHALA
ncbi:MAG: hypothetical protein FJX67_06010 [Alphaproteobacteria bacterium]|nr:hypothetical protein [Alphaproteobacteria bacterium]